jgi:hypothetical protein
MKSLTGMLCLVAMLVLTLSTPSSSQSVERRRIGNFTADVPIERPTPQAPEELPLGHRRIPVVLGEPITSRLLPDDRVVELMVGGSQPFIGGAADAEAEIESITRHADAVAVVRVRTRQSYRSQTDDYIMSRLTTQVQTVLKDNTGELVEGESIDFEQFGGEVDIDGIRVIQVDEYLVPMRAGRTYLVPFVIRTETGKLTPAGLTAAFELVGNGMKRLRADAYLRDWPLDQKTAAWAIERIRAMKDLPRLWDD